MLFLIFPDAIYFSQDLLVTKAEGEGMANSIEAALFLECSSTSGEGVDQVFEDTIRLAIRQRKSKHFRNVCAIL